MVTYKSIQLSKLRRDWKYVKWLRLDKFMLKSQEQLIYKIDKHHSEQFQI